MYVGLRIMISTCSLGFSRGHIDYGPLKILIEVFKEPSRGYGYTPLSESRTGLWGALSEDLGLILGVLGVMVWLMP